MAGAATARAFEFHVAVDGLLELVAAAFRVAICVAGLRAICG